MTDPIDKKVFKQDNYKEPETLCITFLINPLSVSKQSPPKCASYMIVLRSEKVLSLNAGIEIGQSLQPLLFDIIVRNRFRRFCITGDVKKAFLQIIIRESDRDAQRVLWYDDLQRRNVHEFRFARAIFGATSSPYILGTTIEKHLEQYKDQYSSTVKSLRNDT